MPRHRLALSSAVLALGLAVSACGGEGSGAPSDASVADFCKAISSPMFGDLDMTKEPSSQEMVDAAHAWADDLAEVGTPEDMSDDARAGFENAIDEVKDIDADKVDKTENMSPEELEDEADDVTDEERKQSDALQAYVSDNCTDTSSE